ncbi:MAG TPA: peptidoglycan-binding domain-containing protein, partial [Rariglobus sp.]
MFPRLSVFLLIFLSAAAVLPAQTDSLPRVEFKPLAPRTYPRPVESWLEAQIALARRGFSCGPIDGVAGAQSAAALRAFQES